MLVDRLDKWRENKGIFHIRDPVGPNLTKIRIPDFFSFLGCSWLLITLYMYNYICINICILAPSYRWWWLHQLLRLLCLPLSKTVKIGLKIFHCEFWLKKTWSIWQDETVYTTQHIKAGRRRRRGTFGRCSSHRFMQLVTTAVRPKTSRVPPCSGVCGPNWWWRSGNQRTPQSLLTGRRLFNGHLINNYF